MRKFSFLFISFFFSFSLFSLLVSCSDKGVSEEGDSFADSVELEDSTSDSLVEVEDTDVYEVDTFKFEDVYEEVEEIDPCPSVTRGELSEQIYLYGIEKLGKSCDYVDPNLSFPDVIDEGLADKIRCLVSWDAIGFYSDGSFGPDDMVNRAELALMLYKMFSTDELEYQWEAGDPISSDIDGDEWYAVAVGTLSNWEVYSILEPFGAAELVDQCYLDTHLGYADATAGFSYITRSEAVYEAMLVRGEECPEEVYQEAFFSDLSETHPYFREIQCSVHLGLFDSSSGKFRPAEALNRAEAIKIVIDFWELEASVPSSASFEDVATDVWYYAPVEKALSLGLIPSGDRFRPAEFATSRFFDSLRMICLNDGICN